jgi:hypothetical protein
MAFELRGLGGWVPATMASSRAFRLLALRTLRLLRILLLASRSTFEGFILVPGAEVGPDGLDVGPWGRAERGGT